MIRKYEFERAGIPPEVVAEAVAAARQSPCAKSRRGVVIFDPDQVDKIMLEYPGNFAYRRLEWLSATGYNAPPEPMYCNANDLRQYGAAPESCFTRSNCGKVAMHAEANALIQLTCNRALSHMDGFHMLHVEIDREDAPMSCDGPSCWQCSKAILADGRISRVWLLQTALVHPGTAILGFGEARWVGWSALDFHCATLRHPKNNLPAASRA